MVWSILGGERGVWIPTCSGSSVTTHRHVEQGHRAELGSMTYPDRGSEFATSMALWQDTPARPINRCPNGGRIRCP